MRIMQIGNSHHDYLKHFPRRFKNKTTHAELMQAYVNDYYWCCHTLTPALERMGHETFLCVPTEEASQRLWCLEHHVDWNRNIPELTCLAQISWFQPDILYIGSASMYNDILLDHLTYRPRVIVGWHGTITHPHMFFRNYDLILSSHDECLYLAQQQGAQHTACAYPGIPTELANKFSPSQRTDLCFSGYWAVSHPRRNNFLHALAERVPSLSIHCAYHLPFYSNGPSCPDSVQRLNRGPVWGLSMFKAFAASRITLNGFASINFGPQNLSPNMRQLEGMGVGSLMLTESSDNLEAFFTEDKDLVTYSTVDELVDKALYYLNHDTEREAIAAHGLATCHKYYNMDIRASALLDAVNRVLHADNAPQMPSLVRSLNAIHQASLHTPAVTQTDDIHQIMALSLEEVRRLMLQRDFEQALSLMDELERLPLATMKNVHLCRALRCIQEGDSSRGAQLLRAELEHWPENDLARRCLSSLILHNSLPVDGMYRKHTNSCNHDNM